jgi:four helix bundle protein
MSAESLEERLVAFAAAVCALARRPAKDFAAAHIVRQLIRSATSAAANYAEARSSPTPRDFLHKLHICLKELRESHVWLKISQRHEPAGENWPGLTSECNELISIFVTSVRSARRRSGVQGGTPGPPADSARQ